MEARRDCLTQVTVFRFYQGASNRAGFSRFKGHPNYAVMSDSNLLPMEASPMPLPKERFSLSRRDWTAFLLGGAVVLAMAPFQENACYPIERLVPYTVGTLLGLLLISLLPSLLAFYLCRRSRRAASTTFLVFVALGSIGQVGEVVRHGGTTSNEKAVLSHVASTIQRWLSEHLVPYHRICENMGETSPLNPTWLKEKSDLGDARERILLVRKANGELRGLLGRMAPVVANELATLGVPVENRARLTKLILGNLDGAGKVFTAMRAQDDTITAELLKACDLLDKNWGRWHVDGSTGALTFDNDSAVEEFNAIQTRVSEVAEEQKRSQAELHKLADRRN